MRKCDSCLYGEKLYDGTLICQHIVSMQGREATQDYMICNRVAKCDFFLETNVKCSECSTRPGTFQLMKVVVLV